MHVAGRRSGNGAWLMRERSRVRSLVGPGGVFFTLAVVRIPRKAVCPSPPGLVKHLRRGIKSARDK